MKWSSSAHGYPFDKALVTDSNPGKALIAEQLFHRPVVRDQMWLGFPCSLAKAHGLTYFFRLDWADLVHACLAFFVANSENRKIVLVNGIVGDSSMVVKISQCFPESSIMYQQDKQPRLTKSRSSRLSLDVIEIIPSQSGKPCDSCKDDGAMEAR